MAKRQREVGIKHTMITQDFELCHWDWTSDEEVALMNENIEEIAKVVYNRLIKNNIKVTDLYAVKHDKDVHDVWDDKTQQKVVEYKTNHVHLVARFEEAVMIDSIAQAVGLESQFVEKPKSGRYSYDNMVAYLMHAKQAEKHAYSAEEIYTYTGRNYMDVYAERKEAWDKARATKKTQNAKRDIDWLEEKILTGEVKKAQILLTDEYFDIYAKNKRRCEDAFDTYAERKIYKTIQSMENGEFKLSVFFVTGRAGSGKSMFTDNLVNNILREAKEHGEEWEVCSVAASNPFDEYRGEEILVMDDLRGMSLTASDWLKLLDADRVNTGSARYRNKKMACRVIIINSEKDVLEFFYYLKGMGSAGCAEAMDQFVRRILARIVVYRCDNDERRLAISETQKTDAHIKNLDFAKPDFRGVLPSAKLSYDFTREYHTSYDTGLNYLTNLVAVQNKWIDIDLFNNDEYVEEEN